MTKIVIDYKFLNLNETINISRRNVYMANNSKKKEMEVVRMSTIGIKKIENYPVEIVFLWHIKNINSDLDNKLPKVILDSLVESKILENDSLKYISKITHTYVKDKKDYVEMEIKHETKQNSER